MVLFFFIIGFFYFLLGNEEGGFFSLWGQIKYPLRYFASPFSSNVVLIIAVDVGKRQRSGPNTHKSGQKGPINQATTSVKRRG